MVQPQLQKNTKIALKVNGQLQNVCPNPVSSGVQHETYSPVSSILTSNFYASARGWAPLCFWVLRRCVRDIFVTAITH